MSLEELLGYDLLELKRRITELERRVWWAYVMLGLSMGGIIILLIEVF